MRCGTACRAVGHRSAGRSQQPHNAPAESIPSPAFMLQRGAPTLYINDHIALHSVGCATGSDAPAVTLHLYCPPVRRVQLFEPENDRWGAAVVSGAAVGPCTRC